MTTLAKAPIEGSVLWLILLGGALTLLGAWSTLIYQTRWQRRARKADSQRAALLAVRDLLGDVDDAMRRARHLPWEAYARTGQWESVSSIHPDVQTLRSLTYRLRLRAIEVENKELRGVTDSISRSAWLEVIATSEEDASDQRSKLIKQQNTAVRLLGEQLRGLP
jgi:type II secretory pathway component PulM